MSRDLLQWQSMTPEDVWDELQRARAEESCLRDENATKDQTIKALADALEVCAPWEGEDGVPCWCDLEGPEHATTHDSFCDRMRSLLRSIGRHVS